MKNQVYTGTPTSRRQVTMPVSVVAGEPLLVGGVPCVSLDNYQANVAGATVLMNGTFALTVLAATQVSPVVGSAAKPGDKIYAVGTLDTDTNVTYNLTLSKTAGDTFFGYLDPTGPGIASGETDTSANVLIGD